MTATATDLDPCSARWRALLDMLGEMEGGLPAPLHVEPTFSGSTFRPQRGCRFQHRGLRRKCCRSGHGEALKGEVKFGADLCRWKSRNPLSMALYFSRLPAIGSDSCFWFVLWRRSDAIFGHRGPVRRRSCRTGCGGHRLRRGDIIPLLVGLEATVRYGYFLATNPIAPAF